MGPLVLIGGWALFWRVQPPKPRTNRFQEQTYLQNRRGNTMFWPLFFWLCLKSPIWDQVARGLKTWSLFHNKTTIRRGSISRNNTKGMEGTNVSDVRIYHPIHPQLAKSQKIPACFELGHRFSKTYSIFPIDLCIYQPNTFLWTTWTKPLWHSMKSCWVYRDPYIGFLQSIYNWVVLHPPI